MSEHLTAEEFVKDSEAAKAYISKLQQGNVDKIKALAQFGKGIDPGSVANIKIDTFISSFLDENAQLVYLRNLETTLRGVLDEALKSARIEQLTAGNTKWQRR